MDIPHVEFEFLPKDHPDRLENSGMSKLFVSRLRAACFTRLTDFDGMSDAEMLRQPGVSSRVMKAIKEARARLRLPDADNPAA